MQKEQIQEQQKKKRFQLPFVSRKKYEIAKNNYKVAMEGQRALRKEYIECQKEFGIIREERENLRLSANEYLNLYQGAREETMKYKKEIQQLKALCTRNGIKYKKEKD